MSEQVQHSSLVEQSNNYTSLPDPVFNQLQTLAGFLNQAIEDPAIYQQGMDALTVLHHQMTEMVQDFGAIIQAVNEERDEALDNLAAAEDERDNTQVILAELTNAIRFVDGDHPLVSALIEEVEEMNMEYADEWARESFIDMLVDKTNYSWSDCWTAANELTGGGGDPLSKETLDLLTVFIEKVQAENQEDED